MGKEKLKSIKQAGKTAYSGRRRTATKKSGFKSHSDATGGHYLITDSFEYKLKKGEVLELMFLLPAPNETQFQGFGFYFKVDGAHAIQSNFEKNGESIIHEYPFPSWSKYGSIWKSRESNEAIKVEIIAKEDCSAFIYGESCGNIWHEYFKDARESVLRNLNTFSPEGLFITEEGGVKITAPAPEMVAEKSITLKECNRCARYLPVNLDNERSTLAFSNHCIARSPCKHKGFGLLVDQTNENPIQLTYGFQLECRVCKKFVVNAALNPMRTSDQMKEDGQRRRHFELLLSELNQMSPQMQFRHKTGKELTTDIWEKFEKKCFKCGIDIKSSKEMNLDHTRPLALLWQLDETATCLCKNCNSQKRDRFPKDFYEESKLDLLSEITAIPIEEIKNPEPNLAALQNILANLDWLYGNFLNRSDLLKERDGKITAELVCKALDRVLTFTSNENKFSFVEEFHSRNP